MQKLPVLETESLYLSELKSQDIPEIIKHASNPKIAATTTNIPFPYLEKDAIFWLHLAHQGLKNGINYIFGIHLKDDSSFLGGIGFTVTLQSQRAEIGYWIAEEHWNKGIASEAMVAMIDFAFNTLKLNKLTSSHFYSNPASGKVMLKNGMKQEGVLKQQIYKNDQFYDLAVYGLLREDYLLDQLN